MDRREIEAELRVCFYDLGAGRMPRFLQELVEQS
jgi:hypothetical protein